MSGDAALQLVLEALRATIYAAGPLLAVALVAGLLVGVVQTVLQLNEASVSFVVKVAAVVALLVLVGPSIAAKVADYTRASFSAIADVAKP